MAEPTKKSRKRKPTGPFSNELLDQLLPQVSGKDTERKLTAELNHHLSGEAADEEMGSHAY